MEPTAEIRQADTTAEETLDLYPVNAARVHEQVVAQIVYVIRSGQLKVGERLPDVTTLAERTQVSKPVVTEAIRALREKGILKTKRGVNGGITVVSADIPPDLLAGPSGGELSLAEVVEARRSIDLELSLLAAERATPHEMELIVSSLGDLVEAVDAPGPEMLRADHGFHYAIAGAAHSKLLAQFHHRVLCMTAVKLSEFGLYHENRDVVLTGHRDLCAAIENRDPDAIRSAQEFLWATSAGSFVLPDDL